MDRAKFYAELRKRGSRPFGTSLSQSQVQNIELLLNEGQARGLPLRHLAFGLATARHEVGPAMKPVSENLNYKAAQIRKTWPSRFATVAAAAPYAGNPQKLANKVYANRMGNGPEASGDGWRYRGRGYPQTTGEENYGKFSAVVGVDLVKDPDRAMEPRIAATIMYVGMTRGLFTGKKLSDYLDGPTPNYRAARAIINGDVAANGGTVAGYAEDFATALRAAGYVGQAPAPKPVIPDPVKPINPQPVPPAPSPAPPSGGGLLSGLLAILTAFRSKK